MIVSQCSVAAAAVGCGARAGFADFVGCRTITGAGAGGVGTAADGGAEGGSAAGCERIDTQWCTAHAVINAINSRGLGARSRNMFAIRPLSSKYPIPPTKRNNPTISKAKFNVRPRSKIGLLL